MTVFSGALQSRNSQLRAAVFLEALHPRNSQLQVEACLVVLLPPNNQSRVAGYLEAHPPTNSQLRVAIYSAVLPQPSNQLRMLVVFGRTTSQQPGLAVFLGAQRRPTQRQGSVWKYLIHHPECRRGFVRRRYDDWPEYKWRWLTWS